MLYSKMAAILNFDKPRDPNAAFCLAKNLFSFIISLIFNVEPCKMARWKANQQCLIPKCPPSWILINHVTQMLPFDWSKPIIHHYFIIISHRALQNGSMESLSTILYSKMFAILNFDKPRDPNVAFWLVKTYFPSWFH